MKEADARLGFAVSPEQKKLLIYLNSRPSNRFSTMIKKYYDEALEAINTNTKLKDPTNEQNKLEQVNAQPLPIYKPSENQRTTRIFPLFTSVASLARPIRESLCQDFISFDLRSAQLAIVAKLWDVGSIQQLLQKDVKLWPLLIEACGLPDLGGDEKDGIKAMTYALVFGGGWAEGKQIGKDYKRGGEIYEAAREHFDKPKLGLNHRVILQRFREIPIIADLTEARDRQLTKIYEERGAVDAFGRPLRIPWRETDGYAPQSVLATQAQSYELMLLWPVVEEAKRSNDFDIVVWLHDGFYLAFRCGDEKRDRIIKRLKAKVKARADELGMLTELDGGLS